MYGFSPARVEESFKHYALYNACVLDIEYEVDPKTDKKRPTKASMAYTLSLLSTFGKNVAMLGLYMSLFAPTNYEPFETDADGNQPGYNIRDIFDFNLFRNNLVSSFVFQMCLSTFSGALSSAASLIFGVKTAVAMNNPMFESTSPSDFWGKRWNLIIHGALKRGIFKPVYKYSTKTCAIMATFLASGAFHEYLLVAVFAAEETSPAMGKNTAFMVWNAGIITIESLVGGAFVFQWMKRTLPKPLVTFLTLSTALPVAHWFIHPYSKTGFFDSAAVAFPMIKEV